MKPLTPWFTLAVVVGLLTVAPLTSVHSQTLLDFGTATGQFSVPAAGFQYTYAPSGGTVSRTYNADSVSLTYTTTAGMEFKVLGHGWGDNSPFAADPWDDVIDYNLQDYFALEAYFPQLQNDPFEVMLVLTGNEGSSSRWRFTNKTQPGGDGTPFTPDPFTTTGFGVVRATTPIGEPVAVGAGGPFLFGEHSLQHIEIFYQTGEASGTTILEIDQILVIPEPGTTGLALTGIGLLLVRRRPRRSS